MIPTASDPFLLGILFFSMGVILGSFGSVLSARIPKGKSILGRSHCPSCKHVLSPSELIPLVSFILLRGKCAHCEHCIDWRYPLLEVASGVLFVFAYHFAAPSLLQVILLGGALWILLLITIIDIQTQTIPDILNISFILCALLFSLSAGLFSVWPLLLGTGFLGSQWLLSHGRWIGSGDVFLIAGIALLLGTWKLILICLLLSYIFGGTVAAYILIMKKKTRKDAIAFGPFLAVGTMGTLLFGERILVAFF